MSLKSSAKTDVNTQELIIEIGAEAFEVAVEKAYQKQKKNISLPGFRKGKVSRKMAEMQFGEGAFYEDAINALLGPELDAAIRELNLELVDRPQVDVESIDKNDGVVIKAICITKPEVKIPEYKGIKAAKIVKDVTDEEVDAQVETLRQRNARIVSVDDRAAETGDEVTIDFEGFLDGTAFDGGKGDGFPLKLGSGQFIPGFEEQIVGHNIGDEFDINVTFPEDYQMTELAGKATVFKVKIHAISAQELPEMDDEFAKDASEFDSVADLKADIRKNLENGAEQQASVTFENAVFDYLMDNMEAIIPQVMFDRRVDSLIQNFDQSLQQQGMTLDLYLQYTGMDIDSFRETFEDRAKKEVRLRLALEQVAVTEKIEVTEDEIDAGLQDFVMQTGLELAVIKQRIPMDDYRMDLIVGKAAELIKENAVIDNTLAAEKEESAE